MSQRRIYEGLELPAFLRPAPQPGEALSVDRVAKNFGGIRAVSGASLSIAEGENHALIGPNGAGKTTLFNLILGLYRPSAGSVRLYGREIGGLAPDDNLALGRLARPTGGSDGVVWSEERIFEYFPRLKERVNVDADYLSGGEQQMVAVARTLSGNVKLLLLDEPFERLAPSVVLELFSVFDKLREHISIVIVEHNLDLVLALADRVYALERGAIFHEGPAAELLGNLDRRKEVLWL